MPSLDGALVAVGLAVGGSERAALSVFDTATGKQVGAPFVPMGFPGARRSVAWLPGNKSFLYAGYDLAVASAAKSTVLKNQKEYEHTLGAAQTEDRLVLDKGLTELAQIALDSDSTGAQSREPPRRSLGRCSWKLSGRKLQQKIKKSQTPPPAHSRANETAATGITSFYSSIDESFAYSALACRRTGMSSSASFHMLRKSR
jgi:Prolyl oligopeptidase, N-terminal beta-propeller domain